MKKKINLTAYTVSVSNKEITIKSKADSITIILDEKTNGFKLIKQFMNEDTDELMMYLEFYTSMVFTHTAFITEPEYAKQYKSFAFEYIQTKLKVSPLPDEPNTLDEMEKVHHFSQILSKSISRFNRIKHKFFR